MNKTIKQIADELQIDKQKVYRYIKNNHINEAHQKNGTKYFNEAVQMQIKQAFSENEVHHEAHQNHINEAVFDALMKQLDAKDKQIAELQNLVNQEQQLRMVNEKKIALLLETEKQKVHWWQKKP